MQKNSLDRSPAMDVIRCFAFLCVVSVHFFANSGFYLEPVVSPAMHLMTWIRSGCMICVPLFLLLSGYLLCHKKPDKRYYAKIGRTIVIYLMASAICMVYRRIFHSSSVNYTPLNVLRALLDFSGAPYAWYVEMYLGLFLIIPFLNLSWQAAESKRIRQVLLLALIATTILPNDTNAFVLGDAAWWRNPAASSAYLKILPAYWVGMYPITFYFLGCYLREYPLRMTKRANLLAIAGVFVLTGTYNSYRSNGVCFVSGPWTAYNALPALLLSVLVFSFLAERRYAWMGAKMRKVLKYMSDACLGAYLVSFIFDARFYGMLLGKIGSFENRIVFFSLIVSAVAVCSMLLSLAMNMAYGMLLGILVKRRA